MSRFLAALFVWLFLLPAAASAAAHTYWKWEVTVDQGCFSSPNHFANVNDILAYDINGASISTAGVTATDSGNFSSSAANAFDANSGTLDSLNTNGLPTPAWIKAQFPSPVDIAFSRVMPTGGGGGFGCADGQGYKNWTLKWSDDDVTYTTSSTTTNYTSTAWPAAEDTERNLGPAGSHRYWYYFTSRSKTTQEPDAAEIEFHSTVGGSAIGSCTAISSSDLGGFPKTNATDGNTATFWVSNTTTFMTSYIGCDYGSAVSAVEVKLTVRNDAFATNEGPVDALIQSSDDNVTRTTRWQKSAIPDWAAGQSRTHTNPAALASGLLLRGVGP